MNRKRAILGAVAAVAALVGMLRAGIISPTPSSDPRMVYLDAPGWSRPQDAKVVTVEARISDACADAIGLPDLSPQKRWTYGTVRVCVATSDPYPQGRLPACIDPLEESVAVADATAEDCAHELEIAVGRVARHACACRDQAPCQWLDDSNTWVAAPEALTMPAGRWRGAGCSPAPCVELAGFPSLPAECL